MRPAGNLPPRELAIAVDERFVAAAAAAAAAVAVTADFPAMNIALLVESPRRRRRLPLHTPLDQPLDVHRTGVEMIEAMGKRVLKLFQMEVLRATLIRAVQKRAVVIVFGHLQRGILPASFWLSAIEEIRDEKSSWIDDLSPPLVLRGRVRVGVARGDHAKDQL